MPAHSNPLPTLIFIVSYSLIFPSAVVRFLANDLGQHLMQSLYSCFAFLAEAAGNPPTAIFSSSLKKDMGAIGRTPVSQSERYEFRFCIKYQVDT